MLDAMNSLLSASPFMPHGQCYLWQSNLVFLHVVSDATIAIAYYIIAFALLYFVQRRQDVPFRGVFWLFGAFIAACGTTHVFEIWTLWVPQYWVSGTVKAITALISFYTAIELVPRIPKALAMPSARQLEVLNQSLSQEVTERKNAEAAVQRLNTELEARVTSRTAELAQAQQTNEQLLQQEKAARASLEEALEDLQETAERLNIALEAAQMGSWDWNIDEQTQYWSPRTETILGFQPGTTDASQSIWEERIYPEDRSRIEAALTKAQEARKIFSEEYRICLPDHRLRWVLVQGRFVFTDSGQPRRMTGVIKEITESKQAALALEASEARFRAVFEQAAVGMARLSAEGNWLQVNSTFCQLLGYGAEELQHHSFREFTDPTDLAQDEHYYEQLVSGKVTSCQFEKRYLHRDGTSIWTLVTVSVERDHENRLISFIAVIEDIRQLKAATLELRQRAHELEQVNNLLAITNAMLEERNSELDQFAYVASHDLKAPLRAIANLSEWIEEDLGNEIPEENQHQLSLLRNRVHRMEALINGLLEYSRVSRRERQIEDVDVRQMLAETIDLVSPPESFTIAIADNMPKLKTNQTALNQVFSNLISNAVKHHNRNDGLIQITAQRHNEHLFEFAVIDDGPGIEPQYHQKVFTIFQTLKARDEFESTGIGLAVVKKIIESEGGTIRLESDLGKGATFRFTWPG